MIRRDKKREEQHESKNWGRGSSCRIAFFARCLFGHLIRSQRNASRPNLVRKARKLLERLVHDGIIELVLKVEVPPFVLINLELVELHGRP